MSLIIIVLLTIFADASSAGRGGNRYLTNVTHTLDTLLANNRYDKRLRPGFGGEFSGEGISPIHPRRNVKFSAGSWLSCVDDSDVVKTGVILTTAWMFY